MLALALVPNQRGATLLASLHRQLVIAYLACAAPGLALPVPASAPGIHGAMPNREARAPKQFPQVVCQAAPG